MANAYHFVFSGRPLRFIIISTLAPGLRIYAASPTTLLNDLRTMLTINIDAIQHAATNAVQCHHSKVSNKSLGISMPQNY